MADALKLAAEARDRAGKGASRAFRRQGRIPAVIYGSGKPATSIHMAENQLMKLLNTGFFMNSVVQITVGKEKYHTLPRDVQFHPVTDRPLHVDFLRIAEDELVTVNLPVQFINEDDSPGLKRGGVLNVVRHEFEVQVPANAIPDFVEVDVSGYEVGDTIHISSVKLPDNVTPVIDRDFTVATIAAPSSLKSQEEEEEAAAEDAAEAAEDAGSSDAED